MEMSRKNFALSADKRADAREALEILKGSGLSLAAAAALAVNKRQGVVPTSLEVGVNQFLRSCLARNLRRRSVEFYESKLGSLVGYSGEMVMDSLDRVSLREWLMSQRGSETTRAGYLRAVRALYRWARKQEPPLCASDPTEGLTLELPVLERSVGFFSVKEVKGILKQAGPYRAAAALMLFAGVRPSEVNESTKGWLKWQDIDFEGREIRIPAALAKTRVARVLEDLPENLWEWLERDRGDGREAVCVPLVRFMSRHLLKAGAVERWIQDGCRHSFATYHVAAYKSVEKTSLIMGHEGRARLLHQRYRGVTSAGEAKKFFELVPGKRR